MMQRSSNVSGGVIVLQVGVLRGQGGGPGPRKAALAIADSCRREGVGARVDQRSRASTASAPNQSFTVCRAGAERRWVKRTARRFFGLEQVT